MKQPAWIWIWTIMAIAVLSLGIAIVNFANAHPQRANSEIPSQAPTVAPANPKPYERTIDAGYLTENFGIVMECRGIAPGTTMEIVFVAMDDGKTTTLALAIPPIAPGTHVNVLHIEASITGDAETDPRAPRGVIHIAQPMK